MTKRWVKRTCAVVGVAGVVGATTWIVRRDDATPAAAAAESSERSVAAVDRRDLRRDEEFDGVVGHGAEAALPLSGSGIVTAMPQVGTVLESGDVLIEVDGRPVLVLHGSRPAWRSMRSGIDDGPDIEQLEAALVALGYASADDLEVDEEWTADTTTAVKTMQTWLDRPVTGRVEMGDVVFHDGPVRVAEIAGELGDQASAAGISVTGIDQFVAMSVDASDVDAFEVDGEAGPTLEVELPSGETMLASVAEIGVPQTSQDGSTSVAVLLTLHGDAAAILDGTPVAVHVVDVAAEGVLTVPAEALLALAEGGYAVEVVEGATTRLVPVQVGVFADGRVEIEGDIAEGTDVVTA